jgi:2-keto-3-deoxy-L-rhamnonate aldolase RhmA
MPPFTVEVVAAPRFSALCQQATHALQHERKQRNRLAAVSPKSNQASRKVIYVLGERLEPAPAEVSVEMIALYHLK